MAIAVASELRDGLYTVRARPSPELCNRSFGASHVAWPHLGWPGSVGVSEDDGDLTDWDQHEQAAPLTRLGDFVRGPLGRPNQLDGRLVVADTGHHGVEGAAGPGVPGG